MRALAGLLLLALGCGQGDPAAREARPSPSDPPAATSSAWTRLEDSPLSPRLGPVAAFVGGRAVFVGGDTGRPCPPNADCAGPLLYAADGAAYDLEKKAWEPIAEAPAQIPDHASHAVIGTHLCVQVKGMILDYAAAENRWTKAEVPAGASDWFSLTADGTRLVLESGSDEQGE